MVTPLVYPATIVEPFARIGSRNTIPVAPDATPGHASLDLGFPPITMQAIETGGVPPSGLDFNGIFNLITQHSAWLGGGGQYKYDATLVSYTGGYQLGAIVQSNDGLSAYRSMVNNNNVDFNSTPTSIGTNWEPYAGQALNGLATTVATTGGTVVLTTAQAAASVINVTGVLASNSIIQFPATPNKVWRITNSTTGAFGMTAKLAAGASLTLTQGQSNTLFYNGTALVFPMWDNGLDSPAFRGNPTAPTQAPGNNSTRLATTAYVDAAVAASTVNSTPQYINSNIAAGPTGTYWVDTRAGPVTITLPASPVGANPLIFEDITSTWQINNLTINAGANQIAGIGSPLICDVNAEQAVGLWWDTANTIWRVK